MRHRTRRRRPRDGISDMAFRARYLRRSRELWRRYLESKPWIRQLYSSFLNIRPGQKIVDVGCGLGDFTRFLARLSGGRTRILGIDANQRSIKVANKDTMKAGLSHAVSYRVGDVNKIPLEDAYADLTCCRTLLEHLPDPVRAVKEMVRVTKVGGLVSAVEPGNMVGFYDPNDPGYSRLSERVFKAWVAGIKSLEGKDFMIGAKLPGIFQKAGLSDIRAEIHADAYLYTDSRRKLRDVKDEIRFDYWMFKQGRKRDRKYLSAGGLSNETITNYFSRTESRTKTLLSDDLKLRNDPSLYGSSMYLVSGTRKA